jgi:hypothetical protein
MLNETKDILYKLQTEGIGSSIAGMRRGLDLLESLIDTDPEVALKYFKGVAGACEHISGKFLGEGFKPTKTKNSGKSNIKLDKPKQVAEQEIPNDALGYASFVLDGMKEAPKQASGSYEPEPKTNAASPTNPTTGMSDVAAGANAVL